MRFIGGMLVAAALFFGIPAVLSLDGRPDPTGCNGPGQAACLSPGEDDGGDCRITGNHKCGLPGSDQVAVFDQKGRFVRLEPLAQPIPDYTEPTPGLTGAP